MKCFQHCPARCTIRMIRICRTPEATPATMSNQTRHQSRNLSRLAFLIFMLLALALVITEGREYTRNGTSKLAYTNGTGDGNISLMVYDPRSSQTTAVMSDNNLTNTRNIRFSFSADGHLAFSSGPEGYGQIHILATQSSDSLPFNISEEPDAHDLPLAWSPDG